MEANPSLLEIFGDIYEGRERTKLYGQRVKAIIGTYHFTTVVMA